MRKDRVPVDAGKKNQLKDGELLADLRFHTIHDGDTCLRVHLKAPEAYTCDRCNMPGLDPCLKCVFETCNNFHLHRICFDLDSSNSMPSDFFKWKYGCDFQYQEIPEKDCCGNVPYCDICGLDIKGAGYRCDGDHPDHPNTPHHDLHPLCAHLRKKDKRKNEKGVVFKLKENVKSKCLKCGNKYPVEECIPFIGLKWVCKKRDWSFPFCIGGRTRCYHVKCMNELQTSTGGCKSVSTDPTSEYFNEGIKECFTNLLEFIQDLV